MGGTNIRAAHDPRRVDHLLDHHLVERGLFKVIVNPWGDVSSSFIRSAIQVAIAEQLPGIYHIFFKLVMNKSMTGD